MTFLDVAQRIAVRNRYPGPGQYQTRIKEKIHGAYNLKEAKSSFLVDAEYRGIESPKHGYNP